jgi:uncharacterized OB-fold protein
MTSLPTPVPQVTPDTQPFWEAAAAGRFVLARCTSCGGFIWYPRSWCPACSSDGVEWVEASGRGTVYSCTTVRRGAPPPYAEAVPYVLAYVELAEGPRVLTNIITDDPDAVTVGQAVELVLVPDGEAVLPRFRPADEEDTDG